MSMILPLSNLKLRLSQVDYTVSAPCTHTLTPTQAVATHYAHTDVFTSLGIFHTLPCHTQSDIRTRTHTHFYQPITGRQSILNADTEYSKNVQIDYTASAPCAHAHTYTGSCYALRAHICFHIVRQQCSHMRTRTHTHIHATNHQQTKHFNADTDTSQHLQKCPVRAGQSARRAGLASPRSAPQALLPLGRHAHAYGWGPRHGTRSIRYDDLKLAPNSWFNVVA